jgi:hypothetical protein
MLINTTNKNMQYHDHFYKTIDSLNTMHITRACLKPIGPSGTNSHPPLNYLLAAVQAHTTTHCMFYIEKHWASHLLRPTIYIATFTVNHTNDMLDNVLFIRV